MLCLIISDSHSSPENIKKALDKNPSAEVVFFLGDGIEGLEYYADAHRDKAWLAVRGNCDFFSGVLDGKFAKKLDSITLAGKKIVFTHGDLYGVKYGMGGLLKLADEEGADIILYGHTHIPKEEYVSERELWLFNPGSLQGGYGMRASFGLLTLTDDGQVLFSHGEI